MGESDEYLGPYFKGQVPEQCGHYYPDVMRVRDKSEDQLSYQRFFRVLDCRFCGQYGKSIRPEAFSRAEIAEKDLPRIRKSELAKLLKRNVAF
mgnify:CR=1 FL=1